MASRALGLLLAAGLVAGCGSSYVMTPPEGFVTYRDDPTKMITADGIRLTIRAVENYPKAGVDFWEEALRLHLERRGYVFSEKRPLTAAGGLQGWMLDFVVPHGVEDYAFRVALFVREDDVIVVEAAGRFEHFDPYRQAIEHALATVHLDE